MTTFVCRKTLTSFLKLGHNRYQMKLAEPTIILDAEQYVLGSPPLSSIPPPPSPSAPISPPAPISPLSTLLSISHSGFATTAADEMYHTVWENFEGWHEVKLSPLFKNAKIERVLVDKWEQFEVGDPLAVIVGELAHDTSAC
ncbi:hypothetical protein TrCOL_g7502 [Triparma columacea]|uniref:Uncharacterized protein n=1 Tax=Triparma columacea TaxID=722753 RepID=A0A9W7L3K6_9STRA|nr:hypothetical protein TrCOL_g7502 [Triparma columacea]